MKHVHCSRPYNWFNLAENWQRTAGIMLRMLKEKGRVVVHNVNTKHLSQFEYVLVFDPEIQNIRCLPFSGEESKGFLAG